MGIIRRRKHYLKGIRKLERHDTGGALRAFSAGMRRENCPESASWYPYTLLLRSRYRDLAHFARSNPLVGYGHYAAWWYHFMAGEMDALPAALHGMLGSPDYFLRVYGVWRWAKRNPSADIHAALAEKTGRGGLSYSMHLEEKRASVYLHLLHRRAKEAVRTAWSNISALPKHPDLLIDLFESLSAAGDDKACAFLLTEPMVIRASERDFRICYFAAREHFRLGNWKEAIRHLRRLLAEFQHHPLFHHNLGNAYFARGEKVRAIAEWEEAARCAPRLERAYYNAGTVCQDLGDADHARSHLSEAVKMGHEGDAVYNLSVALIEGKEMDAAYYHLARMPENGAKYAPEKIRAKIRELLVLT